MINIINIIIKIIIMIIINIKIIIKIMKIIMIIIIIIIMIIIMIQIITGKIKKEKKGNLIIKKTKIKKIYIKRNLKAKDWL